MTTLYYYRLATYKVVLGLPWLRRHNPDINQVNRKISMRNQKYYLGQEKGIPDLLPTQNKKNLVDKKSFSIMSQGYNKNLDKLTYNLLTLTKYALKNRVVGTIDTRQAPD